MNRRNPARLLRLLPLVLCTAACGPADTPAPVAANEPEPAFIGSAACGGCHEAAFDAWQGSHHALAMQPATDATVLGDFDSARFEHFGTTTEFLRDGERFLVRSTTPGGDVTEHVVTHTFGVEPLQQYLVEFPGGRLQALTALWDSRPAADGGQRWYSLYPDEAIATDDPLHWSGRYFTWNTMCADCHSTGLVADYDLAADRFDTTFAEVTVGCEACHGPGSAHRREARAGAFSPGYGFPVDLDDRGDSRWVMNPDTGIAALGGSPPARRQPDACGRCHSRRSALVAEYEHGLPLLDTHSPVLLEEGLYHADGRVQDEVYVWGSFLQSRMYAKGVTCTDCHEPHTARLRSGPDPNAVCAQCHLPTVFAGREHAPTQTGDCVACHMPETTFMGVDGRRDHSFRIPDAGERPGHYAALIAAARAGDANTAIVAALANREFPAIVRATLLSLLSAPLDATALAAVRNGLAEENGLLRIGALRALRNAGPEAMATIGPRLLDDPLRAVRIEAAVTFADQRDLMAVGDRRAFERAADEYRHSLRLLANMPESLARLAAFETQTGNDGEALELLGYAVRRAPDFAPAQHQYGLALVRAGRANAALTHLERAAMLAADNARFVYVLGVAQNSLGRPGQALVTLRKALSKFPDDFDIGWALATMLRDAGRTDEALAVVRMLRERHRQRVDLERLERSLTATDPT